MANGLLLDGSKVTDEETRRKWKEMYAEICGMAQSKASTF